jgi:hypothetical protein
MAAGGFWARQISVMKTAPFTGPVKPASIFLSTGRAQVCRGRQSSAARRANARAGRPGRLRCNLSVSGSPPPSFESIRHLCFRGFGTPDLTAQGGQRLSSCFAAKSGHGESDAADQSTRRAAFGHPADCRRCHASPSLSILFEVGYDIFNDIYRKDNNDAQICVCRDHAGYSERECAGG